MSKTLVSIDFKSFFLFLFFFFFFQRSKVESMKQMINERRHQIQQFVRETEKIRQLPHRQQILKVMPEMRLQQLLQLDEDQLKNLTYEQIKGTPPHIRPT